MTKSNLQADSPSCKHGNLVNEFDTSRQAMLAAFNRICESGLEPAEIYQMILDTDVVMRSLAALAVTEA